MTPHELEEAGEEAVERLQAPILRERAVRLTFAKMLRAHLAGYDQQQQQHQQQQQKLDNTAAAACEANEAQKAKEEHVPGPSAEAQAAEAVARRLVAFEKRILSAQLQLLDTEI